MNDLQHPQTEVLKPQKKLSSRHRMFVEAYCGDAGEAAALAGYQGTEPYLKSKGMQLLSDLSIMEAIKDRSRYKNNMGNVIASRDERQMLWSSIMHNKDPHALEQKDNHGIAIPQENVPIGMRLKASELLGKSEGDFIDRVDFSGKITLTDVIQESYKIEDKSIEVIEAEYRELRDQKKQAIEQKEADAEYSAPTSMEDLI